MNKYDFLIVGAGFAGITCAQQLTENGHKVLIVDKRSHIGGNAFDVKDEKGILIHPYGPHIFHTNSERVFTYLSRFTDWRLYEHRVLAQVDGNLYPIPINRTTINQLYGLSFKTDSEVESYLKSVKIAKDPVLTSEDVVLNTVGKDLCDKFFRGYTYKQWGVQLSELSSSVTSRIPTRTNEDDRYFTDTFQYMPKHGYTAMFESMLKNSNIEVLLNTDYKKIINACSWDHMVYTGPIDAYFNFSHGKLPYRSLRFDHQHQENTEYFQKVGTVNYPNDHQYTRITEFKHLTGQNIKGTSIVYEYPQSEGDPFYPIPNEANQIQYKKYQDLAEKETSVSFVGRLAEYKYYNMDQVVASALKTSSEILKNQSKGIHG
jgi:UDP-galactopyranose mutase